MMHRTLILPFAAMAISAPSAAELPRDAFFTRLSALCGRAFEGHVVSPPTESDRDFAGKRLMMHVRDCSENEIRVPFRVGDDFSRTWVISRRPESGEAGAALGLSHDHRHVDGSEDRLSRYCGATVASGTESRQEFPADAFSRDLFARENLPVSMENVWAMEVHPARMFAYELRRPGRFFRVEFDLSRPVGPGGAD